MLWVLSGLEGSVGVEVRCHYMANFHEADKGQLPHIHVKQQAIELVTVRLLRHVQLRSEVAENGSCNNIGTTYLSGAPRHTH